MSSAHNIQIMHGSECDIHIWRTRGRKCCTRAQPKCDIFNRGSSYLHVARTATAAVDRSISPRRSAANPPAAIAAVDRQYRQTDGRTDVGTLRRQLCGQCQTRAWPVSVGHKSPLCQWHKPSHITTCCTVDNSEFLNICTKYAARKTDKNTRGVQTGRHLGTNTSRENFTNKNKYVTINVSIMHIFWLGSINHSSQVDGTSEQFSGWTGNFTDSVTARVCIS